MKDYIDAFDTLLTKVGPMSEDMMMGIFVGGLFLDLRARVRAMQPTSLDEAQHFAQLQEDIAKAPRRGHGGVQGKRGREEWEWHRQGTQ